MDLVYLLTCCAVISKSEKSQLNTDLVLSELMVLSKFSSEVTSAKTAFYEAKLEMSAQDSHKLHHIFSSQMNPPTPSAPSSLTADVFAIF